MASNKQRSVHRTILQGFVVGTVAIGGAFAIAYLLTELAPVSMGTKKR